MTFEVTFDERRRIVVICLREGVTVESLIEGYEGLLSDQGFSENMDVLWDLSGLDLARFPLGDIRRVQARLKEFMVMRGKDYKAALMTTRTLDYQLLRVYIGILQMIGANFKLKIFNSSTDALKWLDQ